MTPLTKIQARHEATAASKEQHPLTWASLPYKAVDQMHADTGSLLGLLRVYPASEPPDSDRLVIVRWSDKVGLGRHWNGNWLARGWAVIGGHYAPVEHWQELPPVPTQKG